MNYMDYFKSFIHAEPLASQKPVEVEGTSDILPLAGKTCTQCRSYLLLRAFKELKGTPPKYDTICVRCRTTQKLTPVIKPLSEAAAPKQPITALTKDCSKCFETKPVTEFHKDAQAKDGLRTYCRICTNKYMKSWYAKKTNGESKTENRLTPTAPLIKRCCKCKRTKATSEFHKNQAISDGFAAYCKPCAREYADKFFDREPTTAQPPELSALQQVKKQLKKRIEEQIYQDILRELGSE